MLTRTKKFADVIEEASENSDYVQALTEWELSKLDDEVADVNACICGAPIINQHVVRNKNTDVVLVIGSECIGKFGNAGMNEAVKLKLKASKGNLNGKRLCQYCCDYRIGEAEKTFITFCKTCYGDGHREPSETYLSVFGQPCVSCEAKYIPKFEGADLCTKCYTEKKKTGVTCSRCEQNMLIGNQKVCSECSKQTSRNCVGCERSCIPGNSPEYIKLCDECSDKQPPCQQCEKPFRVFWTGATVCRDCRLDMEQVATECYKCGKNTIMPDDGPISICKKCTAAEENKRQCDICKKKVINPNAKSFVTTCNDCQNKTLLSQGVKPVKCPGKGCKELIPPADARWMKTCKKCYRPKK